MESEVDSELFWVDSVVLAVFLSDGLFIKGYIINIIVERIARTARTMREVSWARFLLVDLVF